MRETDKEIRQTHITPDTIIWSLPLRHAGLAPLRALGVQMAGIDERGPQVWGEGISPTHLCFLVTAGQAEYIAVDPPLLVCAGQYLLVPGGVAKRLRLLNGAVRALWFHLQDMPYWAHLRATHASVRGAQHLGILDASLRQLLQESLEGHVLAMKSCLVLSELIAHYVTQELTPPESADQQRLRALLHEVWAAVRAHPGRAWTVADLADRLGVSTGHFHRLTRTIQHTTPLAMVTRIRMEQAASLLRTTDWPLERIADAVGYANAYTLSQAFLRYSDQRPGAFRKR